MSIDVMELLREGVVPRETSPQSPVAGGVEDTAGFPKKRPIRI